MTLQAVFATFKHSFSLCCGITILTYLPIFLRFTPNRNFSSLLPSLIHHNHPHISNTLPQLLSFHPPHLSRTTRLQPNIPCLCLFSFPPTAVQSDGDDGPYLAFFDRSGAQVEGAWYRATAARSRGFVWEAQCVGFCVLKLCTLWCVAVSPALIILQISACFSGHLPPEDDPQAWEQ